MSLSATFGVFVALGAVLALLLLVLRMLKRFAPSFGGRSRVPMEVVQRLPLGPKHSLAVVRVGERVLTIAIGEGGVQQLGELEGEDRAAVLAASTAPTPFESSRGASVGILAALSANPELDRLPGGKQIRAALQQRVTAPAPQAPAVETAAVEATPAATRPTPRPQPDADAFRSMLGMALSSATKLAIVGTLLGALALRPTTASAQAATAAPNDSTKATVATPAVTTPALPTMSAATRAALVQSARRAAASTGLGRNTQAPTQVGARAAPRRSPRAPPRRRRRGTSTRWWRSSRPSSICAWGAARGTGCG